MPNNILIGPNAGLLFTTESYKLVVKSKTVDIEESITEKEHELLTKVLQGVIENFNSGFIICDCGKYTSGNCSTSVGKPALSADHLCIKIDSPSETKE